MHGQRLTAAVRQGIDHGCGILVVNIRDDDASAFSGKAFTIGASNSHPAAGDNDNPILESAHLVSFAVS
jgi:hypothetical protein